MLVLGQNSQMAFMTTDGRAQYMDVQRNAHWNGYVDHKSVGLGDNSEDCNRGCAISNGG